MDTELSMAHVPLCSIYSTREKHSDTALGDGERRRNLPRVSIRPPAPVGVPPNCSLGKRPSAPCVPEAPRAGSPPDCDAFRGFPPAAHPPAGPLENIIKPLARCATARCDSVHWSQGQVELFSFLCSAPHIYYCLGPRSTSRGRDQRTCTNRNAAMSSRRKRKSRTPLEPVAWLSFACICHYAQTGIGASMG